MHAHLFTCNRKGWSSGRLVHTILKLESSGSVLNRLMTESSKAWGLPGISETTEEWSHGTPFMMMRSSIGATANRSNTDKVTTFPITTVDIVDLKHFREQKAENRKKKDVMMCVMCVYNKKSTKIFFFFFLIFYFFLTL
jgi:hypothetical protein